MKGALIILAVTVFTGLILYILDRRNRKNTNPASGMMDDAASGHETATPVPSSTKASDSPTSTELQSGECCGLHLVCEKELTAIAEDKVLYYDDEELDRFIGRTPDEYSAEEIEEFRDVMLTLLPHDVPGWARSLDRRDIRPPREIRDELLILLQDIA